MTLSAIHNGSVALKDSEVVVCDIGGYDFVSYSQRIVQCIAYLLVVCDIGGYDFVSYSQLHRQATVCFLVVCDIGGYDFVSYSQLLERKVVQKYSCL